MFIDIYFISFELLSHNFFFFFFFWFFKTVLQAYAVSETYTTAHGQHLDP